MNTNMFLIRKVLKELGFGKFYYSIGIILLVFLFLASFQLLFLVRSQPKVTASDHVYAEEGEVICQLLPILGEANINNLFIKIRQWESVDEIRFFFSEELQTTHANLPSTIADNSNLFVIKPKKGIETENLINELQKIDGIETAISLNQDVVSSGNLFQFPTWFKGASLGGAILFALIALFLIQSSVTRFSNNWQGEFEILKYSGFNTVNARIPFITYGFFCGVLSSVISIIALFVFRNWALGVEVIAESLPVLNNNIFFMGLALWAAILGPSVGLLGSLWGSGNIDNIWNSSYDSSA